MASKKAKKLTPAQIVALGRHIRGERYYAAYGTLEALIAHGLLVPVTEIYMIDGQWTSRHVPTVDAWKTWQALTS